MALESCDSDNATAASIQARLRLTLDALPAVENSLEFNPDAAGGMVLGFDAPSPGREFISLEASENLLRWPPVPAIGWTEESSTDGKTKIRAPLNLPVSKKIFFRVRAGMP